jgi:hypothetical protein
MTAYEAASEPNGVHHARSSLSGSTVLTVPSAISGANIHWDVLVIRRIREHRHTHTLGRADVQSAAQGDRQFGACPWEKPNRAAAAQPIDRRLMCGEVAWSRWQTGPLEICPGA